MSMMLAMSWNNEAQRIDLVEVEDTLENWLKSAVTMTLFTDARATADEVPDVTQRGGYWGDIELDGDESIGCKLWLFRRAKLTQDTINAINDAVQDGVDWFVEDGYIASVVATAERYGSDAIAYQIDMTLHSGDTLSMSLTDRRIGNVV